MSARKQGGFTLIELMVTIAILAILALMAYPSYHRFILMGRLENARSAMIGNVQMMEQLYARHSVFSCPTNTSFEPCTGRGGQVPQAVGEFKIDNGFAHTGYYKIGIRSLQNAGSDAYWVTAEPKNDKHSNAFSSDDLNKQDIYLLYFSGTGTFSRCTKQGFADAFKDTKTKQSIECSSL